MEQASPEHVRLFQGRNIYVTLTDDSIESPDFSTGVKSIPWADIEEAYAGTYGGRFFIVLLMKKSTGLKDKPNFWTGVNAGRPRLELTNISQSDREAILDMVNYRIRLASGITMGAAGPGVPKLLAAEREFIENLEELAPQPWAAYALIAVNILVWMVTLYYGAAVMQTPADRLLAWGGNAASEVQRGQWWRLLTASFLHNGFLHILMNMLGLYCFAKTVERIYGQPLLVLIYLGAGLTGNALSLYFSAQHAVSIGASGAVFGIAGAQLVCMLRHRDYLPTSFGWKIRWGMAAFIVHSGIQAFGALGVDTAANVGGLVSGCVLALILPERLDMETFLIKWKARTVSAVGFVCMSTLCMSFLAPKAAFDLGGVLSTAPLLDQGMKRFEEGIRNLQAMQQNVKSGKLSIRESDEQKRTVHAPVFRKAVQELSQVKLQPGDQRTPLLKDTVQACALMAESLEMYSVYKKGDPRPRPADPVRAEKIEKELAEIRKRMNSELEAYRRRY